MFADFGEDVLAQSNPVTFTYATNKAFDTSWPSTVEAKIRADMSPYGNVLKVDRGLFSGRYVITIVPQQAMTPQVWQELLKKSMALSGYPNASFVAMEGGVVSSQSGGTKQAIAITARKVGTDIVAPIAQGTVSIVSEGIKPLVPYLIIGAAGFGLYLYLQYKMARKVV
jgi:hypothetical protein